MTLLETVQFISQQTYFNEDEEAFSVKLLPPSSAKEIESLRISLPNRALPFEVRELLSATAGFDHPFLGEVSLQAHDYTWHKQLLHDAVFIATDGLGNDFVVDVNSEGEWGKVLFIDHDPPVIMVFAESFKDFLWLLHEDMEAEVDTSQFSQLYTKVLSDVYRKGAHVVPDDELKFDLPDQVQLPKHFRVASLEDGSPGFVWASNRYDDFLYKLPDRLVWIIEVNERKDFWGRTIPGVFGPRKPLLLQFFEFILARFK